MHRTIRSSLAGITTFLMVMFFVLGGLLLVAAVLLGILVDPWLLFTGLACLPLFGFALLYRWTRRRTRLEITPEGFTWWGYAFTSERHIRWDQVVRVDPPAPGMPKGTAALVLLRDGTARPVYAEWEPPVVRLLGYDFRPAHAALVEGHKAWLAAHR
ncbi:hypothetical protein [Brevibacterium litoralis]|uniref:hypothetical protein n=1 Tax=Brevibacterium litoralis TaxID=3138935 RepID=UPI0032EDCFE1